MFDLILDFTLIFFHPGCFSISGKSKDGVLLVGRFFWLAKSPGINFTNILQAAILFKSVLQSFYMLFPFLQKEISTKFARKILVKLTTSVNFINTLLMTFSYKSALCSFFLIAVWLFHFLSKEYFCKNCL